MKISKKEVEHVGNLSRLHLSEAETDAFTHQLSTILSYMETLKKVETRGIEPTSTVVAQTNVFREDTPELSLPQERAIANAPEAVDGYFQVPKIMTDR